MTDQQTPIAQDRPPNLALPIRSAIGSGVISLIAIITTLNSDQLFAAALLEAVSFVLLVVATVDLISKDFGGQDPDAA